MTSPDSGGTDPASVEVAVSFEQVTWPSTWGRGKGSLVVEGDIVRILGRKMTREPLVVPKRAVSVRSATGSRVELAFDVGNGSAPFVGPAWLPSKQDAAGLVLAIGNEGQLPFERESERWRANMGGVEVSPRIINALLLFLVGFTLVAATGLFGGADEISLQGLSQGMWYSIPIGWLRLVDFYWWEPLPVLAVMEVSAMALALGVLLDLGFLMYGIRIVATTVIVSSLLFTAFHLWLKNAEAPPEIGAEGFEVALGGLLVWGLRHASHRPPAWILRSHHGLLVKSVMALLGLKLFQYIGAWWWTRGEYWPTVIPDIVALCASFGVGYATAACASAANSGAMRAAALLATVGVASAAVIVGLAERYSSFRQEFDGIQTRILSGDTPSDSDVDALRAIVSLHPHAMDARLLLLNVLTGRASDPDALQELRAVAGDMVGVAEGDFCSGAEMIYFTIGLGYLSDGEEYEGFFRNNPTVAEYWSLGRMCTRGSDNAEWFHSLESWVNAHGGRPRSRVFISTALFGELEFWAGQSNPNQGLTRTEVDRFWSMWELPPFTNGLPESPDELEVVGSLRAACQLSHNNPEQGVGALQDWERAHPQFAWFTQALLQGTW